MKNWDTCDADVVKILTKHFTSGRGGKSIDKIVVHYNAGNLTVEGCYSVWQTREASAHYQVEDDGRIGQLVWDSNTAWHAGNWNANQTSIGIEHANNSDGTITEKCLDNGAHLVAALCKLYKLGRPAWLKNVFPHKHFAATSCPGQIYGSQKDAYIKRAQKWYDQMTGSSSGSSSGSTSSSSAASGSTSYTVKVTTDALNIRKGPGTNYAVAGCIRDRGTYTIVQESGGTGASKWGKLKSGAGWISLDYTSKSTASSKKSVDEIAKEVIQGKWGNDPERTQRLTAAGYDAKTVQKRVNQLL